MDVKRRKIELCTLYNVVKTTDFSVFTADSPADVARLRIKIATFVTFSTLFCVN